MSEIGEYWADSRQVRREKKDRIRRESFMALVAAGLAGRYRVVNDGESLLFREVGFPRVDYFPSTGRWVVPGDKMARHGGGRAFVSWYLKQGPAS